MRASDAPTGRGTRGVVESAGIDGHLVPVPELVHGVIPISYARRIWHWAEWQCSIEERSQDITDSARKPASPDRVGQEAQHEYGDHFGG